MQLPKLQFVIRIKNVQFDKFLKTMLLEEKHESVNLKIFYASLHHKSVILLFLRGAANRN
jgi:hypothetical protein